MSGFESGFQPLLAVTLRALHHLSVLLFPICKTETMRVPAHELSFCFSVCMDVCVKWVNTYKALRMVSAAYVRAVGM